MYITKNMEWNRYRFGWILACLIVTVPTLCPAQAAALQPAPEAENKTPNPPVKIEWLFVQNAEGGTFNNGKMTLKKINPETVMFADRPERIAGHITTKAFLPLWT